MSRTDEIDKIVDEIGDADSLYEFAEGIYEDRQRIAELEEQLKNAIVPKFKKGDTAYAIIDTTFYTDVFKVSILDNVLCYIVDRDYNDISIQHCTRLFADEQEAQEKLKELKNEYS